MKIFKSTGVKTSPCAIPLYMNLDSEIFTTKYSFSARYACIWDCLVRLLTISAVKINDTYYHSHIPKACYPVTEGN